jgi:signal transduction histidine kinase
VCAYEHAGPIPTGSAHSGRQPTRTSPIDSALQRAHPQAARRRARGVRAEVKRIQRPLRHIQRLVDDLSDLAHAQSVKMLIEREEFDLRLIGREAGDTLLPHVKERQRKLDMF